jgi:bacterioferritin-associated ferredoxin
MIICICRGKSDRDVNAAIDNGATTIRDLQRCGIGDQCGSCHSSLRTMLAAAAARDAESAASHTPCPSCVPAEIPALVTA